MSSLNPLQKSLLALGKRNRKVKIAKKKSNGTYKDNTPLFLRRLKTDLISIEESLSIISTNTSILNRDFEKSQIGECKYLLQKMLERETKLNQSCELLKNNIESAKKKFSNSIVSENQVKN